MHRVKEAGDDSAEQREEDANHANARAIRRCERGQFPDEDSMFAILARHTIKDSRWPRSCQTLPTPATIRFYKAVPGLVELLHHQQRFC